MKDKQKPLTLSGPGRIKLSAWRSEHFEDLCAAKADTNIRPRKHGSRADLVEVARVKPRFGGYCDCVVIALGKRPHPWSPPDAPRKPLALLLTPGAWYERRYGGQPGERIDLLRWCQEDNEKALQEFYEEGEVLAGLARVMRAAARYWGWRQRRARQEADMLMEAARRKGIEPSKRKAKRGPRCATIEEVFAERDAQ